ncbi:hypothetical protein NXS98_03735 [Fontisphaera persica]|uniref:hypothetical protein n=1 Tax=Fontisphaera persica TaxID=2974023 RepID=UPI0024BF2B31|nr:hypothetical protein [Fontisphaera persica]WCJ60250.1 hypothetical protein NXS98_03735 [Fontisphaera persica]
MEYELRRVVFKAYDFHLFTRLNFNLIPLMRTRIIPVIVLATSVFLMGCGTVREHRLIVQPLKSSLLRQWVQHYSVSINEEISPNAFGGRDIYGGKVDKGYAEVKLRAIREGRYLDLLVFDVSRDSF